MTAFRANPSAFIFAVVVLCAVLGYYTYHALDRMGGEISDAMATVTAKHYTPPGKTYNTNVVDGKSFVQTQETPEMFSVALLVDGEPTSGFVTKQRYASLHEREVVKVKVRRTRMTKKLQILEVE